MSDRSDFKWKHFNPELILWGVRWYCRYAISYRDLEEMMEERGINVSHTTLYHWVQEYAPKIDQRSRPFLKTSTDSFRIDETYIKVKGQWKYLYRAVDTKGNTLDFLLAAKRDKQAVKRFFKKMLGNLHVATPRVLTVDKNLAYPPAINELKKEGVLPKSLNCRQRKYLNNIIEQSHRFIKRLVKNNHWFQRFISAKNTLAGYEILNMIRRGQICHVKKGDVLAQKQFIESLFGLAG